MNLSHSTLSFRSLLITVLVAAPGLAQDLKPFTNGTVANANDVNANFNALKTAAAVAQATADSAVDTVINLGTSVDNLTSTFAIDANQRVCIGDNATGVGSFVPSLRIGRLSSVDNIDFLMRGDAGGFGWNMAVIDPANLGEFRLASVNAAGGFTDRLVVSATGKVGIANQLSVGNPPSQVHRMHIYGTGSLTTNQPHYVAETDGGTFGPQLRLKHGGPSGAEWVLVSGGSGNGGIGAGSFGLVRVNAAQPAIVVNADGTCRNGSGSWTTLSDERLKQHVQPIDSTNALQSLLALRGVTFEYTDAAIASHGAPVGSRMGFIAQEVENVLPQWVSADADGIRKITEHGTTALVVEALRELDTKNQTLQVENGALRAQVEALAADMAALKAATQPLLAK